VSIPGITDGADSFPEAEIMQSLGDRSEETEIHIVAGDRVWLDFIGGDPKHPVIMGFRTKRTGNELTTRRWKHQNIETEAFETQRHTAETTYDVEAGEAITLTVGDNTIEITTTLIKLTGGGSTLEMDADGIRLNGAEIRLNE
jgi:hypothetical protein